MTMMGTALSRNTKSTHMSIHYPPAPDLPPAIEHLSFRNSNHTYRSTLQPIIKGVDALPSLKVLECDKKCDKKAE
ncbi:hypothetical protein BDR07DRAFT_1426551 [Suillus spraguei]|nr:hypothetical protein BDR07DRAFT_1426551 [Suillus spraguei]